MAPESAWSTHPNLAYAVLVAIPAILFALWADSFERHVRWLKQEKVEFSSDDEIRKIRWMGICGIFCQGAVYLLSFTLAGLARPLPFVYFTLGIVFQHLVQAGLERRLAGLLAPATPLPKVSGETPASQFELTAVQSGRAVGWSLCAVFVYLAIIQAFVGAFAALGAWLEFDKNTLALFALSGVVVGILAGLLVSFALAPYYLKRILPLQPMEDGEPMELVRSCFKRAGITPPGAWLVTPAGGQWHQVFVSGFLKGKGVFAPALFVTRSMVEKFSHEELRAAVLREVSHLSLGHFRKRLMAGFFGAVGAVAFSATILVLSAMYLPEPAIALARLGAILLPLMLPLTLVKGRLARQEREADIYAVTSLGANAEAMISLILKSDLMSGKIDLSGKFPEQSRRTLERIRAFQRGMAAVRASSQERKSDSEAA